MARRASTNGPDGLVLIDKSPGWTSHDVVAKLRGVLGTRKIGHAGTLDPDATGLLVIGVGRATRLLRFATALSKTYEAHIALGVETTTLDASGEVVATHDMSDVTQEAVQEAAAQLTGDILQVPPMVSAIKIEGQRLYELARAGVEVERQARPVTVSRFDVWPLAGQDQVYYAEIDCSSGTYIRTLAADLGHLLGGGAHLQWLRRSAIGTYNVDQASTVEAPQLLPMAEAVRGMSQWIVSDEQAALVKNGRMFPLGDLAEIGSSPWAVFSSTDELLAVYEPTANGMAKPTVVLAS